MWEVLVHTDDVTWISDIYIYHDVSPTDILVYLKIRGYRNSYVAIFFVNMMMIGMGLGGSLLLDNFISKSKLGHGL